MSVYRSFMKQLIRDYLFGSSAAVLGVGSILIFSTLQISVRETYYLFLLLFVSLLIMFSCEFMLFTRHIRPIRQAYLTAQPTAEELRRAYVQAHRFPVLAVRRIYGPHFLGLSIPAASMLAAAIHFELVMLPYTYILLATLGAVLVASMHALIEFFLNNQAIRPVLKELRQRAILLYGVDVALDGQVLVSIRSKFQLSALLIGTFPVFLFSLASQVRLSDLPSEYTADYWKWAALILAIGVGFSALGAWLLSRDVQGPMESIRNAMDDVRNGNFETQAGNIYTDEFSQLVAGFNHMVNGLKFREGMNNQLLQSYFTTLAAALDARDPYTAGHSERVARYSGMIGTLAGLSEPEMDILRKAALLHDIGKIGVRDAVLLKEGRLTDDEFELIKLHPVLGENILKQIEPAEAMAVILPGVRSHHEQYNGRGYPDGLAGCDIPQLGRIIAIADAFDAMTSDRPYRRGMPVEKAISILEEGMGVQWDPVFTPLFVEAMRKEHAVVAPMFPVAAG
ncbi:chemotaxis protein CheY [Paenibacillus swuensis]|uniref:Chemotaxis protein CheY n=1 Tax=Paenibacillus swuensis TaxID=1178515 RepID=A0A172TGZ8_9BACL|nr:HD domain-containing phosphohydrolase [Paenibacillus swuensis]ANE46236.1 chemotaxis protein CheY [Paenibacillus swuensis]